MSSDKKEDTDYALAALSGVVGFAIASAILAVLRHSILARQGIVKAISRLLEAVINEDSE
jgi:hypothetical protein